MTGPLVVSAAPDDRTGRSTGQSTAQSTGQSTGHGSAFGTFGELLQGALPQPAGEFLVTFPMARWARAAFHYRPRGRGVGVRPAHKGKSRAVAQLVLDALGMSGGGDLVMSSDLPEGKGLASSSADLVATVRAVGNALGRRFEPAEIEGFLRGVEPTDGVMYDEIVAFHHREARLARSLGTLPALAVVAHDEGGQVDTVEHNRRPRSFGAADRREYGALLDRLTAAVAGGDLRTVGAVATRSAELNARLRTHRGFAELRALCRDVDGFGLVLAHSGTMLGVLLDADDPGLEGKAAYIRGACAALGGEVSVHRSLGTGDRWTPPVGPAGSGPAGSAPASPGPASSGPADSPPASPGPASSGPADSPPASPGPASSGPADSPPASPGLPGASPCPGAHPHHPHHPDRPVAGHELEN